VREARATCEMGYVRAIYVFLMRLFLVHIDRHRALQGRLVRPDISETLAGRFECAFTRPTTARGHPAGALAMTLLAVVSPASN